MGGGRITQFELRMARPQRGPKVVARLLKSQSGRGGGGPGAAAPGETVTNLHPQGRSPPEGGCWGKEGVGGGRITQFELRMARPQRGPKVVARLLKSQSGRFRVL